MTDRCTALRTALCTWRDERAVEVFGPSNFQNHGGIMFIPSSTVTRIIDCAQAAKLLTLDQLKREIVWRADWFEKFGTALLGIVHSVFPPPPAPKVTSERRCGVCRQPGHNSRST